ncbi:MAG: PilZ domain-containing protein [Elusimicrobia bacterium]|nr:PilZ domain-containing protein [Elusimicrobiota bacterium]
MARAKAKSAAKSTTTKSGRERRKFKRWKVAVLVRCSVPKFGEEQFDMEMWAKDVNEKGMMLEWSRGLNVTHVGRDGTDDSQLVRFEDVDFTKNSTVKVQDLFYDDDGSPFIEGKILWARRAASGNWQLGVQFTDAKKQPQALLGAFKDFLSIVKNPTAAIARASKKSK